VPQGVANFGTLELVSGFKKIMRNALGLAVEGSAISVTRARDQAGADGRGQQQLPAHALA
jgi:hypothetical protein